MKKLNILFIGFLWFSFAKAQSSIVTLTSGSSWTVPACVTSITVECWGAGGGGGFAGGTDGRATGGGGGGAYAQVTTMAVTSGQAIPYSIGTGGAGISGTNHGGDTWFFSINDVLAKGGSGTANNSLTGGSGGQATACIGDIVWSGGDGGSASSPDGGCSAGGGGGSGAGSGSNGNNGTNGTNGLGGCLNGGNGGAGGAANGNGGAGGTGASNGTNALATSGAAFGGGGGGAKRANIIGGDKAGGNGADGGIRITYTTASSSATISYASLAWCTSETVTQTPTITGITGGTFSSSPTGLSIDATSGVITPSASTAGLYTVTYALNGSCGTVTATTSVTINTAPAVSISGNTTVCAGATTGLICQVLPTGFSGTYSWNTGSTVSGITVPGGCYTVTATDLTGCSSSASTCVTEFPNPTANINGSPISCGNSSTILTAGGGTTYSWSSGSFSDTAHISTTGDYYVTVTDANNCSGTASYTVSSSPSISINISGNLNPCEGGNTTITASGGATYVWSNTETSASITVNAGTYSVTGTDSGCTGSASVTVSENPSPTITISGVPTDFCDGNLTTLTAAGGTTYVWSNNSLTNTTDVSATGTYSVTGTDNNGCSASTSASLAPQNPLGDINLPSSINGCTGGEIELNATTDNAVTYLWSTAESTPTIIITETGVYTVTASNDCESKTASVSAEFEICECNFFLPTAFSPNNDGSNDTYQWEADCKSVQSFTMCIFNRWGELVFKTNDPKASWDGRFDGALQSPGVYTVQVIATYQTGRKSKEKRKAGSFTLIR